MKTLIRLITSVLLALILLLQVLFTLWLMLFGSTIDLWWISEGLPEASTTAVNFLSTEVSIEICAALIFLCCVRIVWNLSYAFGLRRFLTGLGLLLAAEGLAGYTKLFYVPIVTELRKVPESNLLRSRVPLSYLPLAVTGDPKTFEFDTILVMQMESANSLILRQTSRSQEDQANIAAHWALLNGLAQRGVVFPSLWALSVQTNRAYEGIYCGVGVNLGGALSYRGYVPQRCLPAILSDHGFETSFFNSYPDPNFQDFGRLVPLLGFQNYLGPAVVGAVPLSGWGVDECEFGDAVSRYVAKMQVKDGPSKPQLINVKFSPNHVPFCRPWSPCSESTISPEGIGSQFLKSSLHQLTCAVRLDGQIRALGKRRVLTVLISDTSWPLSLSPFSSRTNERGVSVDAFLTYGAIWSDSSAIAPRMMPRDLPVSHLDLSPTLLDLLNLGQLPNSLKSVLEGRSLPSNYEACHVLSQPFGDVEFGHLDGPRSLDVYNLTKKTVSHRGFDRDGDETQASVSELKDSEIDSLSAKCGRLITRQHVHEQVLAPH